MSRNMKKNRGFTFEERKARRGFTLIELLVVMTIISVLVGLSLVSYQGARKSARDGKRKADLEQIRSALEMCYADDDSYPATISPGSALACVTAANNYLDPVPGDPVSGRLYGYSGGSSYILCAALETGGSTVTGCASCGTATCNYKVTSP